MARVLGLKDPIPEPTKHAPKEVKSDSLDYGEFIDRLKALQKRKAREPYLLSQEHARLLEQALKGESLVTEQTTSRDTALVKVIGIVLTNLGPQWAPALEVLLHKSCAAMGMDDDTRSFLDILPYKIERGRDNAREHYEERQRASLEACEAVARYGEHTEESSSDPVVNNFNKRFFIGWNGGLSECVYWHDTAQGIKPVTDSSIRLATNHMSHKNEKDKVIKTLD